MKLKVTMLTLALFVALGAGSACAGLIYQSYNGAWMPTDGDQNFFRLFDFQSSAPVDFFITNQPGGTDRITITLSPNQGETVYFDFDTHTYSYGAQSLTVGVNNQFWIGYINNGEAVWSYDVVVAGSGKMYGLSFGEINMLLVDASPVPLPASVWLLGASLAGLIGLRRKSIRS